MTTLTPTAPDALSAKAEAFALHYAANGNASAAYREVFNCAPDIAPLTVHRKAYALIHTPAVRARVRELQTAAAERAVISVAERMAWLDSIVHANPDELSRVVVAPCPGCWGEMAHALAVQRYLEALSTSDPLPAPDVASPNDACPECSGAGITRRIITPTDQLSVAGRRLFKGTRVNSHGDVDVLMHDQLAASDQLNKMQAAYTSVSVSARVEIDPNKPNPWDGRTLTPEQVLERVRRSRPAAAAEPSPQPDAIEQPHD